MRHFGRKLLIFSGVFISLYLILFIAIEFLFYMNKPKIEKTIAETLLVDNVKLKGFFNLPFFYFKVENLILSNHSSMWIKLKNAKVYYNLLNIPKNNPLESIYYISVDRLSVNSHYDEAKEYISKLFEKYSYFYITPEQKTIINIKQSFFNIEFLSDFKLVILMKNLKNIVTHERITFDTLTFVEFNKGENINFIQAISRLKLDFPLKDGSNFTDVTLNLNISNTMFGGLTLLENDNISITSTNLTNLFFDILKNLTIIKVKNNQNVFHIQRNLIIDYPENRKFYLLEYLLPKGEYLTTLSGNLKDENYNISLSITNNSKNNLLLNFYSKEAKNYLDFSFQSEDGKKISGKISLNKTVKANIDFFIKWRNIITKGIAKINYFSEKLDLIIDKFYVNNIYLKRLQTTFNFTSNCVFLNQPRQTYGVGLSGEINNGLSTLNVQLSDIAINDYLDLKIDGKIGLNFYISPFKISKTTGNINLYSKKFLINLLQTSFDYEKYKIKFDRFFVLDNIINSTVICNFTNTNDIFYGNISGNALLNGKFSMPLEGETSLNLKNLSLDFSLLLDRAIKIEFKNTEGQIASFKLKTSNYALERFKIPGKLNTDISFLAEKGKLTEAVIKSSYDIEGNKFNLFIKGEKAIDKKETSFNLPIFIFESSEDKLLGKGKITQTNENILFRINFVRNAQIDLTLSPEDAIFNLNISKFAFKIPGGENSFSLSTKLNILLKSYRKLELSGSFSIMENQTYPAFSLIIPYIIYKDNEIKILNASLNYDDFQTKFLAGRKNNGSLNVWGNFSFKDLLSARYNLVCQISENKSSIIYKLEDVKAGEISENLSGKILLEGPYLLFYSEKEQGISGIFINSKEKKEWKIDLLLKNISASAKGEISKDNSLNTTLNFNLPVETILSLYNIKNIKGIVGANLNIKGSIDYPDINGTLTLKKISFSSEFSKTKITDFESKFDISNSYVIFDEVTIPTSTGNFLASGFVNIKNPTNPEIKLKILPASKKSKVSFNYAKKSLYFSTELLPKQIELSGNNNHLNVNGDILIENTSIFLPLETLILFKEPATSKISYDFLKCNLDITLGNNNVFSSPLNQFVLKKGGKIKLAGPLSFDDLKITGEFLIDRGDITYISRNFNIMEGVIRFTGEDIIPFINLTAWYRYRDVNKENVDIYLTFEGKATKIILKEFYSIPDRNKNELAYIIGLKKEGETETRTDYKDYIRTGADLAENVFFFTPLTMEIKRKVGLDMLTFRSTLLQNYLAERTTPQTNVDFRNYLSGSGIMVGKYILPNLFFEYDLFFEKDPYSRFGLIPVHTFGLDLDLSYFNISWKYQPYSIGKETIYEQSLEFKFMRKF